MVRKELWRMKKISPTYRIFLYVHRIASRTILLLSFVLSYSWVESTRFQPEYRATARAKLTFCFIIAT